MKNAIDKLNELCNDDEFLEIARRAVDNISTTLHLRSSPHVQWFDRIGSGSDFIVVMPPQCNRFRQALNLGYGWAIGINKRESLNWTPESIDILAELLASYAIYMAYNLKIAISYLEWVEPPPRFFKSRKKWGKGKHALVNLIKQGSFPWLNPADLVNVKELEMPKYPKANVIPIGFGEQLMAVYKSLELSQHTAL